MSADLFINSKQEDYFPNLLTFEVKEGDFYRNGIHIKYNTPIRIDQDWSLEAV